METLSVTGMGMATSLGLDVRTCCAAARAGVVRPTALETFPVRSPDDGSVMGLVVHAAPLITEGFEEDARLLRLAAAALKDLQTQTSHQPWRQGKAAFYLSLPDPLREYTGAALIPDEEARRDREEQAKQAQEEPMPAGRFSRWLQAVAHFSGWPCAAQLRHAATSGHTGVAEALIKAGEDLAAGRVEVAVVGGVDSLLDEATLVWLQETLRLKTPELAAGLQPGEAGAFLVLESGLGALRRQARTLGQIRYLHEGVEPRSLLSGATPLGEGLAALLDGALPRETGGAPWIISDQNGEVYRAMEWGHALVRLKKDRPALVQTGLWYPALSFGDTGAASGAVAVCLALEAFRRGSAPAGAMPVVVSSAEGAARTAIGLRKNS